MNLTSKHQPLLNLLQFNTYTPIFISSKQGFSHFWYEHIRNQLKKKLPELKLEFILKIDEKVIGVNTNFHWFYCDFSPLHISDILCHSSYLVSNIHKSVGDAFSHESSFEDQQCY